METDICNASFSWGPETSTSQAKDSKRAPTGVHVGKPSAQVFGLSPQCRSTAAQLIWAEQQLPWRQISPNPGPGLEDLVAMRTVAASSTGEHALSDMVRRFGDSGCQCIFGAVFGHCMIEKSEFKVVSLGFGKPCGNVRGSRRAGQTPSHPVHCST